MITLKNSTIKALIDPEGAELKSLAFRGKEYLWQGSADSWNGQSPQLFPVIGTTPEGGWDYRGKKIEMGNHGFARKSRFTVIQESDDSCLLRLKDSPGSLKEFPFPFILDIEYRISGEGLKVSYGVENPGADPLLFSLGAHPGFNCPLSEDASFEDYYLEFNRDESISRRWKDVFLTGEKDVILDRSRRINLDYSLFERGAIILSGLKSESLILKSDRSPASVRMDFRGFPDFGIWTIAGKKAPYLCLEPWFGVDSTEGDVRDFEAKEGLVRLEGKKSFSCSYSLTLS